MDYEHSEQKMMSLYSVMLEKILFPKGERGLAIIVSESKETERESTGSFFPPIEDLVPKYCEILTISSESYFQEIEAAIDQKQPQRLFLLTPWVPSQDLPENIRRKYGKYDSYTIALMIALRNLPNGCLVGTLIPSVFGQSENMLDVRQHIWENHNPQFVIEHDHAVDEIGVLGIHALFRAMTLVIRVGRTQKNNLCFCKYSEGSIQDFLVDLNQLLKRKAKTNFGYWYEDGPENDYALSYGLYSPKIRRKHKEILNQFGASLPLSELVDFVPTVPTLRERNRIKDSRDTENSIPLIGGRNILKDGSISVNEVDHVIAAGQIQSKWLLEEGDICIRSIADLNRGQDLHLAIVKSGVLPIAANNTVIVMRIKKEVTTDQRKILIDFLRSTVARQYLENLSFRRLSQRILDKLQIPIPGPALLEAIDELNKIELGYHQWIREVQEARNRLYSIPESRDARILTLSNTRRVRQRFHGAVAINTLATRIRTQFPHPIAYRWKIIETSYPTYEAYKHILECAEVTVAYLATIGLLVAAKHGIQLAEVEKEAKALGKGKSNGKTFGYWRKVLEKAQKELSDADEYTPFYEVLRFPHTSSNDLLGQLAEEAVDHLYDKRNEDAHNEGPKGFEVQPAYYKAKEKLTKVLEAAEFLSEYRLIFIEKTRRDTLKDVTFYDYRELMGDHHLAPLIIETPTTQYDLEAQSLYLIDRDSVFHLLRPYLIYHQAAQENRFATFYLNSYDPENKEATLRSMELGDTVKTTNIDQFTRLGLLES